MNGHSSKRRGDCLTPTDLSLLDNPLDFIAEDHLHERAIYALIDAPGTAVGPQSAGMVLTFLIEELPMLLADEDEDLFPMMLQNCAPEDEIGKTIDRLKADHNHTRSVLPDITATFQAALAAQKPADDAMVASFANHRRRHLIVENAIILPIARVRLTPEHLDAMRLSMLRRRGLDSMPETEKNVK